MISLSYHASILPFLWALAHAVIIREQLQNGLLNPGSRAVLGEVFSQIVRPEPDFILRIGFSLPENIDIMGNLSFST